MFGPALLA